MAGPEPSFQPRQRSRGVEWNSSAIWGKSASILRRRLSLLAQAFASRTMASAGDPGVAVIVVRHDGSVWCRGFGSDPQGGRITCDTPFAIASLTKSVTALGVMQLAAKHEVRLDVPVSTYLPSFRPQDGRPITVRNLLQQRSGFSTADGLALMAQVNPTIAERVTALNSVASVAAPGTSFMYSNANYDVLGALIERISGQTYTAYVNAHIFQPSGSPRFVPPANKLCAAICASSRCRYQHRIFPNSAPISLRADLS
jgi:CubicO group peptidase (beta-lactamase class C family)